MQYLYTHFANRIQFCEKGAFRNFAKFKGKNTCGRVSFFIKLQHEVWFWRQISHAPQITRWCITLVFPFPSKARKLFLASKAIR